jgi:hypothetical protein
VRAVLFCHVVLVAGLVNENPLILFMMFYPYSILDDLIHAPPVNTYDQWFLGSIVKRAFYTLLSGEQAFSISVP